MNPGRITRPQSTTRSFHRPRRNQNASNEPLRSVLTVIAIQIPGLLAKTVKAVADKDISVLALHQTMRQVNMQFVVNEADYNETIKSLHASLVEIHDHGRAICMAC